MTDVELVLSAIIDNQFVYARSEREKSDVVRLVVDSPHPDWASQLYLWDRPCRSIAHHDADDEEFPAHQLRVYTSPETGWGALNFYGDERAWDSCNPVPSAESPELWFDPSGDTRFHPSAAIPLDVVRAAVGEFAVTGLRPTCTEWQPARLV